MKNAARKPRQSGARYATAAQPGVETAQRSEVEQAAALAEAVDGLRERHPDLSASRVLTRAQGLVLLGIALACVLGFVVAPVPTGVLLSGCVAAIYVLVFVSNVAVFRRLIHAPHIVEVTDEEACAIPDNELPVYTVMIAAYHEPEVIATTLRSLAALDYPAHLLDIKLLLEADDEATRAAVRAALPAPNVDVVRG